MNCFLLNNRLNWLVVGNGCHKLSVITFSRLDRIIFSTMSFIDLQNVDHNCIMNVGLETDYKRRIAFKSEVMLFSILYSIINIERNRKQSNEYIGKNGVIYWIQSSVGIHFFDAITAHLKLVVWRLWWQVCGHCLVSHLIPHCFHD